MGEPARTGANVCTSSTSWGHWFEPSTAHPKGLQIRKQRVARRGDDTGGVARIDFAIPFARANAVIPPTRSNGVTRRLRPRVKCTVRQGRRSLRDGPKMSRPGGVSAGGADDPLRYARVVVQDRPVGYWPGFWRN